MPVLGLGMDLVETSRVERLVSRDEDIFRSRILGSSERSEIPLTGAKSRRCRKYACSIAAKEAFLKALGTGLMPGMRWSDIELVEHDGPTLAVTGQAASVIENLQADKIHVSLSAPGSHVQAVVILTRENYL
jgi:holo-[acyl-carrier protein] synthase